MVDYVSSEWLWHYLMRELIFYGVELQIIFLIITLFYSVVFSVYLARSYGLIVLILLLNPLVIDFAFSQLRLAFAISLLGLILLLGKRGVYSFVLAGLTPFIHTASLIFIIIYLFSFFASKISRVYKIGGQYVFSFLVLCGVSVSLIVGPFRELILVTLSIRDRREVVNEALSSSILYSSFWIILLLIIAVRSKVYKYSPESAYGVVILSLVTTNAVVGGYSTRFLAASMPLLIVSMMEIKGIWRVIALSLYVVYAVAQWLYWLG